MIHVLRPQAELLGRELALEEDGEEAALNRMGLLEGEALVQELARAERPVGHKHGSLVAPGGACWQGGSGTGAERGQIGRRGVGEGEQTGAEVGLDLLPAYALLHG